MASPSALALQTLYRLDASSPDFEDQLYHVLNGVEYTQCVPNLGEGDLTWLVNYLDEVIPQCVSPPHSPLSEPRLLALLNLPAPPPGSVYVNSETDVPLLRDSQCPVRSRLMLWTWIPSQLPLEVLVMYTEVSSMEVQACASSVCAQLRGGEKGLSECVFGAIVFPVSRCSRRLQSLCRDAVTWKCLRHPNVVPFLGCIVASFQIISAWMPGGTLMEHIRDKPEVDFVELVGPLPIAIFPH